MIINKIYIYIYIYIYEYLIRYNIIFYYYKYVSKLNHFFEIFIIYQIIPITIDRKDVICITVNTSINGF